MQRNTLSCYLCPGVVLEGFVEKVEALFRVISWFFYGQISNLVYVNAV